MAGYGGVWMDIIPRLDMAVVDKLFGNASRRASRASDEMARAFAGQNVFAPATTQLDRYVARMETQMRAANAVMDRASERQVAALDRVAVAERRLEAARARSTEILARNGATSASYLSSLAAQERATRNLAAAQRELTAGNAAVVTATRGVDEAARRQAEANTAAAAAAGRFSAAAAKTTAVVGVGMAAALIIGANKAADLNQQLNLLVSGAGESHDNLELLRDGVLDLQSTWGASAKSQADALLLIERAGFHGADALKVLTAGVQASKAEGSNLSTVVHQLTTTMKDFHVPITQVNEAMSASVAAAAISKTTLEDYAAAIGTVEAVAASAGMNLSGLNAAFSVMTQHGLTAQNAAQNIRHAILTLQSPQGPQRDALGQFGISVTELQAGLADPNRQLGGTMQMIQDAIDKATDPATGRVRLDPQKMSKDASKSLAAQYENLNPFQRKIADRFSGQGEVSDKSFRAIVSKLGGEDQARLTQWFTAFQKLHGVNSALRKGMNPDLSVQQAQKLLFGDQPTLQVANNIVGKYFPEYQRSFAHMEDESHNEPDGTVKGANESQQSLNAQLANLKGSINSVLTDLGQSSQGPLTSFVKGLSSSVQMLRRHETAVQTLTVAAIGAGTALLLIKAGNGIAGLFGAGEGAFGALLRRGVVAGGRGIGSGVAATGRGIGGATAAIGRGAASVGSGLADYWAWNARPRAEAARGTASRAVGNVGSTVSGWATAGAQAAAAGVSAASNAMGRLVGALRTGATSAATSIASISRGIVALGVSMAANLKTAVVTGFINAWSGIRTVTVAITQMTIAQRIAAASTRAWAAAQALLNLAFSPVGLIVIGVAALVAGLIYAYKHSETFRNIVDAAIRAVGAAFQFVWDEVLRPWFENLKRIVLDVWSFVQHYFGFWKNLLTGDFSGAWSHARGMVSAAVDGIKTVLSGLGAVIKALYSVTLKPTVDAVGRALTGMRNFFSRTVDAVRSQWSKLQEITAKPVRWIIQHVYDRGVRPLWNRIDKVFGGGHQLPEIKFEAAGGGIWPGSGIAHGDKAVWTGPGVIPGYKPGHDEVNARLSPGESVLTPEATRELGPSTIMALNRKSGRRSANDAAGMPIHAAGGFLGGVSDFLDSAWDKVADAGAFTARLSANPAATIKSLFAGTMREATATPGEQSQWRRMLVDIPRRFVAHAVQTAANWNGLRGNGNASTPFTGSGDLDGWITQAMAFAGVDPGHWGPGLRTLIMRESGGNPNARNDTDINAANGDPSRGLMQTIGATFDRYHDERLSPNIYDPVANIVAGIRYIQARYGDIDNVQQANPNLPPKGYEGGGVVGEISDKKRSDGPDRTALDRAHAWLNSVLGTPYQLGGLDCSMLISGIYQSLLGRDPNRRAFNTMSDFLSLGFKKGLGGIFSIGVLPKPGAAGHMAATFDGLPVETSGTGGRAMMGAGATGADGSLFTTHYYLPGSLFSPPYTGAGARPGQGQAQANKLDERSGKLRAQVEKAKEQERAATESAAKHDKVAEDALADAARYDANAAEALLPSDRQRSIELASKARERARKARTAADKARDKAAKARQRAEDTTVQADQADQDSRTARTAPERPEDTDSRNSADANRLLTPREAGERIGGILVDGLLETFGLEDTVFADPNKSYLLRVGNAILNPFAKVPKNRGDSTDRSGSGPDSDDYDSGDYRQDDPSEDYPVDDEPDDYLSIDPGDDLTDEPATGWDGSPEDDEPLDPGPDVPSQADTEEHPSLGSFPRPQWLPGVGETTPLAPTSPTQPKPSLGGTLAELLGVKPPQVHDQGGYLMPGLTLVNNATGIPEPVLAPREKDNLTAIARMGIGANLSAPAKSWVHIENYHQGSNQDGHAAGRQIAREMNAYIGGGSR
ncbi:phage tail tape measure protein [Nocardia brasiliensis]|uniref:Phage tail tape measure protein n=1 Tax=Nocardia brasiliensis TaxID=37326 RepID=A0A6G9Y0R0_NOCBR|nr:phage tail tape measure protein [Nocardia brasiliensis]QIS06754.1 phage tail tape measure protein [Nocardia brasiliensis]